VLSHFKARPTPTDARCPACKFTVAERQPGVAWQVLLDHISQEHLERGHSLANTRPDFNLMQYLYCKGIIMQDQMRLVQVPAAPGRAGYIASQDTVRAIIGSSDEPWFSYANPQRERRMGRPKRNTAFTGAMVA